MSLYEDLLELGGNSLPATQLVSRIREELDAESQIHQVFCEVESRSAEDVDGRLAGEA